MSTDTTFQLPSQRRKESLGKAAAEYAESIEVAEEYLINRGLPLDVARGWQLGYVLDPHAGHETYKRRLSIPYLTPGGVVDIKFRCLDHDRWSESEQHWVNDCKDLGHPKYVNEAGSTSHLFGVWNLRRDSSIMCICEGELDTIAAWSLAGLPAVGVSGTQRWRGYWRLLFDAYDDVVVFADGDDAGRKFSAHVASSVYNARGVHMPPGHDVNSFIVQYGPEALRDKVGVNDAGDRYSDVA